MIRSNIILLLITFVLLSADGNKGRKHLEGLGFRYIPSGKLLTANGDVAMKGFYFYEAEISNAQYQEFLRNLKKAGKTNELLIATIDTAGWIPALNFENTYAQEYHVSDLYADYPVVNISYEAANLFCAYLQELIRKKIPDAEVRLPTENEWVYAARGGLEDAEYPWGSMENKAKKDMDYCNYNSPDDGTCLATNFDRAYMPNAYGLYNLSGNAAEMLFEKGRTKGGSWNSSGFSMRIEAADEYEGFEGSSPYIGFRPVVIVP